MIKRYARIPIILLVQNASIPIQLKDFKISGYPSGVTVLSIMGNTSAVRKNLMESGETLPFSFKRNRTTIMISVRMMSEN